MKIVMYLLVIGLLLFIGPYFTYLALNTLGAGITWSFWTWLALFWLHIIAASGGSK